MATPNVYVFCDQNCKYEGMTKEQILAAIVQAVNEGTIGDVDTGFIQTVKTINGLPLRFFVGTQAAYDELTDEDKQDLFAIITNDTTKEGIVGTLKSLTDGLNNLINGLDDGTKKVKKAEHADKAGSATNATSAARATKATNDGNGNVITKTYLKRGDGYTDYEEGGTIKQVLLGGVIAFEVVALNGTLSETNEVANFIVDVRKNSCSPVFGLFLYNSGTHVTEFKFMRLYFAEVKDGIGGTFTVGMENVTETGLVELSSVWPHKIRYKYLSAEYEAGSGEA